MTRPLEEGRELLTAYGSAIDAAVDAPDADVERLARYAENARHALTNWFIMHSDFFLRDLPARVVALEEGLRRIRSIELAPHPDEDEYGYETCGAEGYNSALRACQSIAASLLEGVGEEGESGPACAEITDAERQAIIDEGPGDVVLRSPVTSEPQLRAMLHKLVAWLQSYDIGKVTYMDGPFYTDLSEYVREAGEVLCATDSPTPPQPSEAEVERVARAIYSARIAGGKSYCGFDDLCTNGYNDTYEAVVADARAALSAMSRPDPEKLAEIRERHDHLDGQLSKRTTEITAYEGYSAHADLGTVLAMLEGTR